MAWMCILECCDGSYFVGSTKNLNLRISDAFYREKQAQGWTRRKREALLNGKPELLPVLAKKVFDKSKIKGNMVVE